MKNAVIYARYSSQGQNEQSIESQIRTCSEFAEGQGYNVIDTYSDKARTGTNDSRPSFQHMIKDAASGGHLVYGYKLRIEPTVGRRRAQRYVEIDEEQAEIIRYIFAEYDKGTDKKEIAAALNAQGARFNGKPFLGRTFDKWLTNPKYTGEFYFGGRLCANTYPAIIDKALFERVQKRLAANRYFAGGTATAREPYLLTGKAFCAHCGAAMISDGGTSRTGQQHHYYICKGKKKGVCEKRREDKDGLEMFVTQVVYDFLSDENNARKAVRDTLAYYEKRTGIDSIKSIEGKIAKVQRDIDE